MKYYLVLGQVRHGMLRELRRGHDVHCKGVCEALLPSMVCQNVVCPYTTAIYLYKGPNFG